MEMHDEEWAAKPERRGPSLGVVILLSLLFGVIGGFGGMLLAVWSGQHGLLPMTAQHGASSSRPATSAGAGGAIFTPGMSFADIADQLNTSVVNINTTAEQMDPYSMFFGNGPREVQGLGTGLIVDPNGYILTNYHVAGEAKTIKVTVLDAKGEAPKVYQAKLVGGNKQEDLALIKIDASGLKPVQFGDSDKLRPGDAVMAIGNPFGFEHTVSVGVVSALNRILPVEETVMLKHMIQTDASINPGNSGGPLVNAQGEVVGINTAIFVGGGNEPQANGIGFAIPSNHASLIMQMLRDKKKFPYIGVSYEAITDDLRRTERLPVKIGVIVKDIYPGSPAAKAGLRQDDLLLSVDGKALTDQNLLSDYVLQKGVGASISLDIKRWNADTSKWDNKSLRVKIAEKPANFEKQLLQQQQQGQRGAPQSDTQGDIPFPFPFSH